MISDQTEQAGPNADATTEPPEQHQQAESRKQSTLKAATPNLLAQETIAERQARAKAEREAKRARLDDRHRYLIEVASCRFGLKSSDLEETFLDGSNLEDIDDFFAQNGRRLLVFVYHSDPNLAEQLALSKPRTSVSTLAARLARVKVQLADSAELVCRGEVVLFGRLSAATAITRDNIAQEVFSAGYNFNEDSPLQAVEQQLKTLFVPVLGGLGAAGWGQVAGREGQAARADYFDKLATFVGALESARDCLDQQVVLKRCESVELGELKTPADFLATAVNAESLRAVEAVVQAWMKQIGVVLAENDQIRREADDAGPRAELDYWKGRTAKFNSILEQLKSREVKAGLGVLQATKSRLLVRWRELDARVTDSANEARDNVKYLYTLERFCDPLYCADPVRMLAGLAGLMSAIRMIHSVSRYYNTSERMTSLLVKVTNQMITACKAHVTEQGARTIWTQEQTTLFARLRDCTRLNDEYQAAFQRAKSAGPGFESLSEMYIFGKFNAFAARCQRIVELFTTAGSYARLLASRIEGIDAIVDKFRVYVDIMRTKPYDALDLRRADFDDDYELFKRSVAGLNESLVGFVDRQLANVHDTQRSFLLLKRLGRLQLPELSMPERYGKLLGYYEADLDRVLRIYTKTRDDPALAHNMPPLAGRILWSRQLYRRIQAPMNVFEAHPGILERPDAVKVVRKYNQLAAALVEYELLHHRLWTEQTRLVLSGVHASLLVRTGDEYAVNFDPEILTLIRECECMRRIPELAVPGEVDELVSRRDQFKRDVDQVRFCVERLQRLHASIRPAFRELFGERLRRLEAALAPGLASLTWVSPGIGDYCQSLERAFEELEVVLARAEDIATYRVDAVLAEIARVRFYDLDTPEPATIEEFYAHTEQMCARAAAELAARSANVEGATAELVRVLYPEQVEHAEQDYLSAVEGPADKETALVRRKQREHMQQAARDFLVVNYERCTDAVVRLFRSALDELRRRITTCAEVLADLKPRSTAAVAAGPSFEDLIEFASRSPAHRPFLRAFAVLDQQEMTMQPKFDEIQRTFTRAVKLIVNVARRVPVWSSVRGEAFSGAAVAMTTTTNSTGLEASAANESFLHSKLSFSANSLSSLSFSTGDDEDTFYALVKDNKDLLSLGSTLATSFQVREQVVKIIDRVNDYKHIWQRSRELEVAAFMLTEPVVSDFACVLDDLVLKLQALAALPASVPVGMIALSTERAKQQIAHEVGLWRQAFGRACQAVHRDKMTEIGAFIGATSVRLARDIADLDQIRMTMEALAEVRDRQLDVDRWIQPIEDCYALLLKHGLDVPGEELELAYSVRYQWSKLLELAAGRLDLLLQIQPTFKRSLENEVREFTRQCARFLANYRDDGPMVAGLTPREASDRLFLFKSTFDALYKKFETCTGGQRLFGLPESQHPELGEIRRELELLSKLYGLYNGVLEAVKSYYELRWTDLNVAAVLKDLDDFKARCKRLPTELKSWQAYEDLRRHIDDLSECCPLLTAMKDEAMRKRHWDQIGELCGQPVDVENETLKLRDIMALRLLEHRDAIEDICTAAVREKEIKSKLDAIKTAWSSRPISFSQFKTRGELLVKGDTVGELLDELEETLILLSSLVNSRYNSPYKRELQQWVGYLTVTGEVLEQLLKVQNLWIYLEAVFVGSDIAKQMPAEARKFAAIDKSWLRVMDKAHEQPNVVDFCSGDGSLVQLLPYLLEQLELCQKSLAGYLEKKRLLFPRFFFVSDPGLLEILGQASDCHTIQSHLLSLFDNTKSVTFDARLYDLVLAVHSSEGETVTLEKPVRCEGQVESWLGQLLAMSQRSVHGIIRNASDLINEKDFALMEFLGAYPAQIGILALQLIWTRDATLALRLARSEKRIMQETNEAFSGLLDELIEKTTATLSALDRTKYETMITVHVHQRDIFDELCKASIKSPLDFEWLKQTRFYFSEDQDRLLVNITDVEFVYQNEFLGCPERLVITPLTDRCYITLAQAIHMCMGGMPTGPAGTGKTETTKDMGRCLGKYVVVFNCSDQMDFRGLGRIFKGLAQSGSWGCFDEFNRIDLPVLSVAAQQIAVLLQCRKERRRSFVFTDGETVEMNAEFGVFLTMNPGYAGRQELPENLKMNFRNVAMMVPDFLPIIRVKMAAAGFLANQPLAKKFYVLYKFCNEQLSKQVHYDFGLRNILSVLRTLGASKRSAAPGEPEEAIVMRVLRDMNLSKLIDEDEPLFKSLIGDLFPGLTLEKAGHDALEAAIRAHVSSAGLVDHPPWTLKLVQLYETQLVRHGIMTLGPAGAGKTCAIQTLMRALSELGRTHREVRMNPKAITAPQMFGRLDAATNDWTDGIFSTLWRRTKARGDSEAVWLVLDGPVDAIWIENLNSVLDDNRTLTLANGDRIAMAPSCKILFEVHNIDNASPATVSRNGMVYMSSSGLGWRPLVEGWTRRERHPAEREPLLRLFEASFSAVHSLFTTTLDAKMDVLECMIVAQMCSLLSGLLPPRDSKEAARALHLDKLYVFALMWSFGALLEPDGRAKLQEFLRRDLDLDLPDCRGEREATIFDYFVGRDGVWEHWSSEVRPYRAPADHAPEYSSILVPNVDNVRTDFLLHTIAKQGKAVLLIGEQGTAKTVIINSYLRKYDAREHVHKTLNFSSATTPGLLQRAIEGFVDKRVGATYGPAGGKRLTLFLDDVNMPQTNEWGDQVTNELVRQLMEQRGFYSLDKPGEFTTVVDVQLVAAMIHPGGGRNDIPQRLKRQFAIFNCTLPSNASVDKIFSVIGLAHYSSTRGFAPELAETVTRLVPATRRLWQATKSKLLPTPAKFHYVFNLRDLSRVWQGLVGTEPSGVADTRTLVALWKHECTRVLADRFVDAADQVWFGETLNRVLVEDVVGPEARQEYADLIRTAPLFCSFLRDAPEATGFEPDDFDFEVPRVNEPVRSWDALLERLRSFMSQYNESVRGTGLDLVFFKEAVHNLLRIARVLYTHGGNALLVGVGGSGKQSLTRLASFIAGYSTFQITLTRAYNAANLLEDLKSLYRTAGQRGKGVTFLFTDQEVKDEAFLEYINNVLASGGVAGLFAREELDEIYNDLVPAMKREWPRRAPSTENLAEFFMARARRNLHVVLCFSPVGERFRSRALKFPGLISGCTVNWFQRWPREALIAVAEHHLAGFSMACSATAKAGLVQSLGAAHDGVERTCRAYLLKYRRTAHVTPKSYLSFLAVYKSIYREKNDELTRAIAGMDTGLRKLDEASVAIAALKETLLEKDKEIAAASERATSVLADVERRQQEAEKIRQQIQLVKDRAQAIFDSIQEDQAVSEHELRKAQPLLDEAEEALNSIKPAEIADLRTYPSPPHLIMRVMDCVLLLNKRPVARVEPDAMRAFLRPSWEESRAMMANINFLRSLVDFKRTRMLDDETMDLLEPYFRAADYDEQNARRAGSIAGLLKWTLKMREFFYVYKEIAPLKDRLFVENERLRKAQADLDAAQARLDEKNEELAVAQRAYRASLAEKQALVDETERSRRKIDTAGALIVGLGDEKVRWTEQSRDFKAAIGRLAGDAFICAGFLSYQGPFNQEFRASMVRDWQRLLKDAKITHTGNVRLVDYLASATQVGEWRLQGLPNDELSVQNALIATKASRYPLLIDPQGQGRAWIRQKEAPHQLQTTGLNHKYFRQHLEDALSLGRPLLVEDVGEELDPVLDRVLERDFIKSGTRLKVKVGDKEVDVDADRFRLYITTKLSNPAFSPEVSAKTAVIDFTVTAKGLEDQLLGRVINTEKRELEAERISLLEDIQANKKRLKELEDELLLRLTSSQGSFVDDDELITVLNTAKATAIDVRFKLRTAAETGDKISAAREEFRPVAARGSILYFLLVDMSLVNVMYQSSLRQFLQLFDASIEQAPAANLTSRRVLNIVEHMTGHVYAFAVRGFYEQHKLIFTLLLALKVDMQSGLVRYDEFQTLIKGGAALDLNAVPAKPFAWIADSAWLNLCELAKLFQFGPLLEQIARNERAWKLWFDREAPELEAPPDGYAALDAFRRLLLVRSWCPDRTLAQARRYIQASLGERYVDAVVLDLERMWHESGPRTPLVCLLSMGSDPSALVEQLAKRLGADFRAVSMGQGQEVPARRLVAQAMLAGGWVLLQNCHLSLDFGEELVDTLGTAETVHAGFRLWITTEVHARFPIGLLQMSIKYTAEPPQGIRAGLTRTFQALSQELLDASTLPAWRPLLYGVAFLHTIVQERRKFGPLGWNVPYEFNAADFNATVRFVQNHLDELDSKRGVSWPTVRYMIAECQYGGRVTDDFDKILLGTLTSKWFGEQMFAPGFTFTEPAYAMPVYQTLDELARFVQALPGTDRPEAFGLHGNADITYQTTTARTVLDTILDIQPKEATGEAGETREAAVHRIAQDMLRKLPADYVAHEVRARLAKSGGGLQTPMNIFLRQEIDRMQRLIGTVRQTLVELRLGIDGAIVMNEHLRNALDSIYDAKIPERWQRLSWESASLGFWFTELVERNGQFRRWCFEERPVCFWLSGFFNAQGFLTAMKQEVTRANKDKGWSLDTVEQVNEVLTKSKDELSQPPQSGVYIYGLYLEGAGWSKQSARLTEARPKVLFEPLPVVHVSARSTVASANKPVAAKPTKMMSSVVKNAVASKSLEIYQCPVFRKSRSVKHNYVTKLTLRTNTNPEKWVLRGVRILCDKE